MEGEKGVGKGKGEGRRRSLPPQTNFLATPGVRLFQSCGGPKVGVSHLNGKWSLQHWLARPSCHVIITTLYQDQIQFLYIVIIMSVSYYGQRLTNS
jgi:hypothetical protein